MLPEALKQYDILNFPSLPSHNEVSYYAAINVAYDSRGAGAGVADQSFAWLVNM